MDLPINPDAPDYDPDEHMLFLKTLRHSGIGEMLRQAARLPEAIGEPQLPRGVCDPSYARAAQDLVHVQRCIDELRAGNPWYVDDAPIPEG
jgi:hypothetical protein